MSWRRTWSTRPSAVWPTGATSGVWTDVDRDGDPDYVANAGARRAVFVNKLRHLSLAEPVRPGGAMTLTFEARSGEQATPLAVWMALSFAEITPTWVPGFGWLMVDPLQAGLVGGAVLPSGAGQTVHQEPVPASTALLGAYLTVQPLELRGDRLRLGNQVETVVR